MLSLRELTRVAETLDALLRGGRLRGIAQTDAHTLFLRFHVPSETGEGRRHEIRISCHPEHARVGRVAERPQAPPEPLAFCQFLRAHLDRARFVSARIVADDRQLALRFETKEAALELLLSVLGPRSNLYLLDGDEVLRAAMRPLADTRRELAIGERWRHPDKKPPSAGEDRFAEASGGALLDAIEAHYGPLEQRARGEADARRLTQVVGKELDRVVRRIGKLEQDAGAGEEAAKYHRQGELLKTVLKEVAPGARSVVAKDFATGEDVTIPLDETKNAQDNLERIFKRYHKAVKRATVAGGQLAEAEERRAALEALRDEVAAAIEDPEALAEIGERDLVKKLLARHAPPPPRPSEREGPKKKGPPARLQPKRYRSSADLEIWVGKNDEGNDHLTTRLARGKDLFFHLEASPGSHVILRTEGRTDPPQEAVLEACELAVHFSKQRKATRANVHVVPIKNVKKPKGAKPGLVYVTGGKTIHLRRDPARLARVLDGAIPD